MLCICCGFVNDWVCVGVVFVVVFELFREFVLMFVSFVVFLLLL